MFREAARKTEKALLGTLDDLEAAVGKNVESAVVQINTDYGALLKDQNIFKELTAARDAVQNLLTGVDERFERVLRSPAEPAGSPQPEEAQALHVDNEAPTAAVDPDLPPKASASSSRTPAPPETETQSAMAVDDSVHIKVEPSPTAALTEDAPMRDV
jgi:hypothetical protein